MQNFDPAKVMSDVASLAKELADIRAILTGGAHFDLSSVGEALDVANATARLVGDFVPQIARLEMLVGPLLPIIPALVADYSGSIAGEGATVSSGVVIPAEQLGKYEGQPGSVSEAKPEGGA